MCRHTNQSLLVRGDTFLLLNLGLDIVDRVGGFDLKGDGLTGEAMGETLMSVVIGEGSAGMKASRLRFDEDLHLDVSGSYSIVRGEVLGVPVGSLAELNRSRGDGWSSRQGCG
jgi:hypothetical protein